MNFKSKPQLIVTIGVPVFLVAIFAAGQENLVISDIKSFFINNGDSYLPKQPGLSEIIFVFIGLLAVAFLVLRQRK